METLRMLVLAAATGRVGYVFFIGDRFRDWRVSEIAATSPEKAAELTQKWVNELKPDVIVTEKTEEAVKKGDKTKAIIGAIARTAEHNYLLDVSVKREHQYVNKYEEAEQLARRFPDILGWLPKKRRFQDNEPRNIVLFEALSLAETVLQGPATTLAAAMD